MKRFSDVLQRLRDPGAWLARARDADYWRGLDARLSGPASPPPAPAEDNAAESLRQRGYCALPRILPATDAARLADAVEQVRAEGWHPVFALALTTVWEGLRHPSLISALQTVAGAHARLLPRLWVHHVEAAAGARGWEPHADYPGPVARASDGSPLRLTAWLALTEATAANGCIHVIPRDACPSLTERFHLMQELPMDDVVALLHAAHAVPLPAGSLMAWDFGVVHWGGRSVGSNHGPRIAISMELLHAEAEVLADDAPLLDPRTVPPFTQRLHLIGRALEVFGQRHQREPSVAPFLPLARALRDAW